MGLHRRSLARPAKPSPSRTTPIRCPASSSYSNSVPSPTRNSPRTRNPGGFWRNSGSGLLRGRG
eukprot:9990393-Alexandrium_andersonii.AAC.1